MKTAYFGFAKKGVRIYKEHQYFFYYGKPESCSISVSIPNFSLHSAELRSKEISQLFNILTNKKCSFSHWICSLSQLIQSQPKSDTFHVVLLLRRPKTQIQTFRNEGYDQNVLVRSGPNFNQLRDSRLVFGQFLGKPIFSISFMNLNFCHCLFLWSLQ